MILDVIDTETTGLTPDDKIVELAVVSVDTTTREIVSSWSEFTWTDRPTSPEARATHHITPAQIAAAMPIEDVIALRWKVRGETVGAHNAAYDRPYLTPYLKPPSGPWVCSLKLSRYLWPDAPGHSNQVLRYWLDLGVEPPEGLHPHRALYDALVTAAIFIRQLDELTIAEMIEISNNPIVLKKISFGKYKGKEWKNLDRGYLSWITKQGDMDPDALHTARFYLR